MKPAPSRPEFGQPGLANNKLAHPSSAMQFGLRQATYDLRRLKRKGLISIAWRQFDCALDNFINNALTTA